MEKFSREAITALYPCCPYKITVKETVSSTNTLLKELARQGAEEKTVLIAENQTEGRGRLGRRFESPYGTGLYMTVLLRPDIKAEDALFITTSAAVAAARAIEKTAHKDNFAKIKWVNDIFINDLKVCGILTESAIDFKSGRLEYAVVGIGVNIFSSEILKEKLSGIGTGIFEHQVSDVKNRLAAEILKQLETALKAENHCEILSEYKKRSCLRDKSVTVINGTESYPAVVKGIDDKARLIVETADGKEKALSSGEVSISMHKMHNG